VRVFSPNNFSQKPTVVALKLTLIASFWVFLVTKLLELDLVWRANFILLGTLSLVAKKIFGHFREKLKLTVSCLGQHFFPYNFGWKFDPTSLRTFATGRERVGIRQNQARNPLSTRCSWILCTLNHENRVTRARDMPPKSKVALKSPSGRKGLRLAFFERIWALQWPLGTLRHLWGTVGRCYGHLQWRLTSPFC
jgi:hypothetical protein